MRKIVIAAALAAGLSGCATGGGSGSVDVSAVQQDAVKICGFLPTAETILNIFASGNTVYVSASIIANAICAAVTAKSARRGSAPTVNGVVVHGTFVRGRGR